jgi:hypothetical protein
MPYLSVIQFIMYLLDTYSCLLLAGPIFYFLVFDISYMLHTCCWTNSPRRGAMITMAIHNENNHRDTLVDQDIQEYNKSRINVFASKT